MELTYDEIMDVLDIRKFPSERTGYTLLPGKYEISDTNKTLKNLLHNNMEVSITNDDIRVICNLKIK